MKQPNPDPLKVNKLGTSSAPIDLIDDIKNMAAIRSLYCFYTEAIRALYGAYTESLRNLYRSYTEIGPWNGSCRMFISIKRGGIDLYKDADVIFKISALSILL